ncbi:MAG: hypothetical protein RL693_332 [Verrucomicrobiota bacterium]
MKTKLHHPVTHFLLILGLGFYAASTQAQEQKDPYKKPVEAAAPATPVATASTSEVPGEPDRNVSYSVMATIEWIDVNTADAMALMRGDLAPNSAELIHKIRDLETQGKATLVDAQSVTTRSGQRAISEGCKELIYPTEFERASIKNTNKAPACSPKIEAGEKDIATQQDASGTLSPTAFEVRPVGGRFEMDPTIGPDLKTLDINMAPEYTIFTGWEGYGKVRVGGETVPMAEQPIFASSKITTAVTIMSGQTIVAGMVTVQNEDGTVDPTKKRLLLVHGLVFPVRPH